MNTTQNYIIGDCLEFLPRIPDKSVNLILTDLPYGQTACAWDSIIDLERLWAEYKRILTPNGAIVLTCTFKFGVTLVNNAPDMFRYDLVWEKTKATGFLNANKMPMRNHEMILVFYNKLPTFNPQYTKGEAYTRNCGSDSNIYNSDPDYVNDRNVDKDTRNPVSVIKPKVITDSVYQEFELATVVNKDVRNPVSVIKPDEIMHSEVYGEMPMIGGHRIRNDDGLRNPVSVIKPGEIIHSEIYGEKPYVGDHKPNVEGARNPVSVIKPGKTMDTNIYGGNIPRLIRGYNKPPVEGQRSPVSIIKHQNGNNATIHPTQKPLSLWEYIIKTYTNPGDMVHDSCLGSGTTLEACQNLNRNCICFELSDEWEDNYKSIQSAGKGMWKLSKIFGREL